MFRNTTLWLLFILILVSAGTNLAMFHLTQSTFANLNHESERIEQVTLAQNYATKLTTIAEFEATRAHEYEQSLNNLADQFMNLQWQASMQDQYIRQLLEYIKANGLEAPTFGPIEQAIEVKEADTNDKEA